MTARDINTLRRDLDDHELALSLRSGPVRTRHQVASMADDPPSSQHQPLSTNSAAGESSNILEAIVSQPQPQLAAATAAVLPLETSQEEVPAPKAPGLMPYSKEDFLVDATFLSAVEEAYARLQLAQQAGSRAPTTRPSAPLAIDPPAQDNLSSATIAANIASLGPSGLVDYSSASMQQQPQQQPSLPTFGIGQGVRTHPTAHTFNPLYQPDLLPPTRPADRPVRQRRNSLDYTAQADFQRSSRFSSQVHDWINQLGRKQQIQHLSVDGLKDGDAKRYTDLKLAVRTKEPYMPFSLEECSPAEQLAVWEARANFLGQHLQGTPLHKFSAVIQSADSDAIRYQIRSGRSSFSPDLVYHAALAAVEEAIYDGRQPQEFHIQQLEKLTRKHDVENYNKLFKDHLIYVPPHMMTPRQQWTQWLDGLKAPDVKAAVELHFIGATSAGDYPLQAAMLYAAKLDEQHRAATYGANPYGALRTGGPTANTPYAYNGGRGGGHPGPNVSWGARQDGNSSGGPNGAGGRGGNWWQQQGPGRGAGRGNPPPPPSGAGPGRDQVNRNA